MEQLSHFDGSGQAAMVDVSEKPITLRVAVAGGRISMNRAAFDAVASGSVGKGDVLGVARVAGIMGAKRTAELVPLCHPIFTEKVSIEFDLQPEMLSVQAVCTAQASGKTGVEMEALCGVQVALLTIYDMCKAADKGMVISDVCLWEKRGGKSGNYQRQAGDAP